MNACKKDVFPYGSVRFGDSAETRIESMNPPAPLPALSPGRVGVLEDDPHVRQMLARFISAQGGTPREFRYGTELIDSVTSGDLDLVLVDLGLPAEDGIDVVRRVRMMSRIPIVIVSGRTELPAVSAGLDAGADDYVRKPISFEELGARVRSLLRRVRDTGRPAGEQHPRTACLLQGVPVDFLDRTVGIGSSQQKLTEREGMILAHLLRSQGALVTRDELSRSLIGNGWNPNNRALDVHISHLRKKLADAGCGTRTIQTHRNFGYRCVAEVAYAPAEETKVS